MRRLLNASLFSMLLATAFAANAQTPTPVPPKPADDEVIKVSSRLIVVPASVVDANGEPVGGLTAKDFRLREESNEQTIEQVSGADKVPLEIALLFDISASTDSMFQFELETASKFLKGVMKPDDRATVFSIGAQPAIVLSRGGAEQAAAAIQTLAPTKGYTAFFDAVAAATEHLKRNAPEASRRVILVISDGEDTNSERIASAIQNGYKKIGERINTIDPKSLYQLTVVNRNQASMAERLRILKMLQDADTVFYSINPAGNSYQLNKMSVIGQENMQKFAEDTGGAAFLPKLKQIGTKDAYENATQTRLNAELLNRIFTQLTAELRAQYLIQYYTEADYPANKYVKLEVTAPARPGARVRSRQGYYVKK